MRRTATIEGYWGAAGTAEPPQPVADTWPDDETRVPFVNKLKQVEEVGNSCFFSFLRPLRADHLLLDSRG